MELDMTFELFYIGVNKREWLERRYKKMFLRQEGDKGDQRSNLEILIDA